jgi:hypothetical protein
MPLWASTLVVVVLPTLLAMAGTLLVRRRMTLTRLRANNEVAGFKFAVVGVIYAVLLAFAVFVVWEQLTDAENDIAHEAGSATNLYRLVNGIGGDPGRELRTLITRYVETAIGEDWPAMERGNASAAATEALNALYAGVLAYQPADRREQALMSETLRQLSAVTEARRSRLVKASGIVPAVIWLTLLAGAVITVGFTYFFGTRNVRAQMLMTAAVTVLICSGLLVILTIDHPFDGAVKAQPDALVKVLEDFGSPPAPAR